MINIITHNQIMSEIKTSLNHILHSLTDLSTRINPTFSQTQPAQSFSSPTHPLSPPTLPPSNPVASYIPKPITATLYPVKYLTYSEMQQRRDNDLCLNCDEKYTSAHRCQTQRILVILPNDDSDLKPQPPPSLENMKHVPLITEKKVETNEIIPMMRNDIFKPTVFILDRVDGVKSHSQGVKDPCDIIVTGTDVQNGFTAKAVDMFLSNEVKPAAGVHMADFIVAVMRNCCPESLMVSVGCTKVLSARKIFIFDPGGKIEFECLFVAQFHGYAQLNYNPSSTFPTPQPPTHDLEDKVDFKETVMMQHQLIIHHMQLLQMQYQPRSYKA